MMRIITSINNNLPTNKKEEELTALFRGWNGTLFESKDEYKSFVETLHALVSFLNAKYPRTTPYHVVDWGGSVSIMLESSDKGFGFHCTPVSDYFRNRAGWFVKK